MQIALTNNKVMRSIGGQVQGPPEFILRNPQLVPTVYDPALAESNPNTGVEAALSAFDTQFSSSLMWQRVDAPNNWWRFDGLGLLLPYVRSGRHRHVRSQIVEDDGHRRRVLGVARRRLREDQYDQ